MSKYRAYADSRPLRSTSHHQAFAFGSATDLASALRRAEAAHREHEKHEKHEGRSHVFHRGEHVEDWPAWYAAYLVAEQTGTDLPS